MSESFSANDAIRKALSEEALTPHRDSDEIYQDSQGRLGVLGVRGRFYPFPEDQLPIIPHEADDARIIERGLD